MCWMFGLYLHVFAQGEKNRFGGTMRVDRDRDEVVGNALKSSG